MGSYRYGFNGKENDNEVKGEGNQQDYGFRVYDTRIGKFLSIDPLTAKYPWYTPYQFAGNTPIQAADLDGLEEWMKQMEFALKRKSELQMARAEQIRRQSENWRYKENDIIMRIDGVNQMGPESQIRQNAAIAQERYNDALGAAISNGPFGSLGYMIGGDEGAFKWSAADGVMTSFGGIPAGKSSVFPNNAATRVGETEVALYEQIRSVPKYKGLNIALNQSTTGETVPGRVQSRIDITNEGWAHVIKRHFYGRSNASQFSISEKQLRNILSNPEVLKSPIIRTFTAKENGNDVTRFVRQVVFSGYIGFDKMNNWKPTSTMTIMTDKYGELISATPGAVK